MPIPHWSKAPSVWDTVTLGGVVMPGVATVECDRKATIDKKKPKGKNNATPTVQGVESPEVSIHWELNTEDEWNAFVEALAKVEPQVGQPLDIAHPATAARKIDAILVESLKGPIKPPTGNSFCRFEVKAMGFKAPPKPTGTGGGKGATGSVVAGSDVTKTPDSATGNDAIQKGAGSALAAITDPAKTHTGP